MKNTTKASQPRRYNQVRDHFVETYVSSRRILEVLNQRKHQIKRWAFILHDKDVWDDESIAHYAEKYGRECPYFVGERKIPHYHVLLQLTSGAYVNQVRDWFWSPYGENTFDQICDKGLRPCYEYLTHQNYPNKHQYSSLEIISNDMDYFEKLISCPQTNDNLVQALGDMMDGFDTRYLVQEYGRDFIINFKNVKAVADAIHYEEHTQDVAYMLNACVESLQRDIDDLEKQKAKLEIDINNKIECLRTLKVN